MYWTWRWFSGAGAGAISSFFIPEAYRYFYSFKILLSSLARSLLSFIFNSMKRHFSIILDVYLWVGLAKQAEDGITIGSDLIFSFQDFLFQMLGFLLKSFNIYFLPLPWFLRRNTIFLDEFAFVEVLAILRNIKQAGDPLRIVSSFVFFFPLRPRWWIRIRQLLIHFHSLDINTKIAGVFLTTAIRIIAEELVFFSHFQY